MVIKLEKRALGSTGIMVSPLGLGTVKFGRNEGVKYPTKFDLPDEKSLMRLLDVAREHGINLLDTAPAYGISEERLGRLLFGRRQDWVIVGKAGEDFENGESVYHFTPQYFELSVQRTLRRLHTDHLDVLLIHSDGNDEKILANEGLIETMHDFKKRGIVRAVGASTKTIAGGLKALEVMDVAMVTYNPSYTDEKPVLDYAAAHNKGILLKKALASGHINVFDSKDPVQTAMDFAFAHKGVGAMIVGTINLDHLRHNVKAARQALSSASAA